MGKNSALLIVDVQEFLINHAYEGQALIERIANVVSKARHQQVPVLFIQHCEPEGEFQIGTPTWQIHHAVRPLENEPVIHKFACDSFFNTTLSEELASKEINHLIIAGLQSEYCIDSTCRRAVSFGYDVTLVGDCHSTFDNSVLKAAQIIAHHNAILSGFRTLHNNITVNNASALFT